METLRFEPLVDRPNDIALIAKWYFDEWGYLNPSATLETVREKLAASINQDGIPLTVVAVMDEVAIGAAQLKYRELPIYPELEHWLGGVFVVSEHRFKGVAAQLVHSVTEAARGLGVRALHVQTQRLDGGLYRTLGWQPLQQIRYRGLDVLVMERDLHRGV